MLDSLVAWSEGLALPQAMSRSVAMTGLLSGLHLIGLVLIVGGALMACLRGTGVMFTTRPLRETIGGFATAMSIGLAISITTGFLLVAWRLGVALESGSFRIKMLLLLGAAVFHVAVLRPIGASAETDRPHLRATVAVAFGLWVAVALAGSAFILLE